MTMGASVMWYSLEEKAPSAFPDTPWAVQFNDHTCQKETRGNWDWETGLNRHQVDEFEYEFINLGGDSGIFWAAVRSGRPDPDDWMGPPLFPRWIVEKNALSLSEMKWQGICIMVSSHDFTG